MYTTKPTEYYIANNTFWTCELIVRSLVHILCFFYGFENASVRKCFSTLTKEFVLLEIVVKY